MGLVRPTSPSFHWPSHSWHTAISKFDLENQGQGHSLKATWRVQSLSTHIPSVLCQLNLPFLKKRQFWNLTLKILGQGHGWGQWSRPHHWLSIYLTYFFFILHQMAQPFIPKMIWPIECLTTKKQKLNFCWKVQKKKNIYSTEFLWNFKIMTKGI